MFLGFTVNIGDMMQVLSNGHYKAPLHRVLANLEKDRYSAPFFYNPPFTTDVTPILSPNGNGFVNYLGLRDYKELSMQLRLDGSTS